MTERSLQKWSSTWKKRDRISVEVEELESLVGPKDLVGSGFQANLGGSEEQKGSRDL